MVQGTFSAQLQRTVPERTTRTQRLLSQEQERKERAKFQELKAEAERLRSEKFSNLTFEQYKQEYQKLSPDLKQFFLSPSQITAKQEVAKKVEMQKVKDRLIQWQNRLDNKKQEREAYQRWWHNLSSKEKQRKRENYDVKMESFNQYIENYETRIRFLQKEKYKVDLGYEAGDIIDYAEGRGSYTEKRAKKQVILTTQYQQDIATGKLDQALAKLNLPKTATYSQFTKEAEKYNKDVAYIQSLQTWAGKVGFTSLPGWAKTKVNPQAMEWQKEYPSEVLQFDSKGNVIAVKSGTFGGKTFSLGEYDVKVKEYQDYYKQQMTDYENQQKMISDAQVYLKEKGFAEGVDFTPPKQSILGKIWSGLKTVRLSSIFGTAVALPETQQEEITELREGRVIEALTLSPSISAIGTPAIGTLELFKGYKFLTIPFTTSWETIQTHRGLDYKSKQAGKLFEELETYTAEVSPELKPYVEVEALNIMKRKGIKMEETISYNVSEAGKYGEIPETTTIKITDPAFDRRISHNLLEWERELEKQDRLGEKWYQQLVPRTVPQALLGIRIISSKVLETYVIGKGVQYGVGGVVAGWQYAGLPTKFYQTVKLTEGIARVPRSFTALKTTLGVGITGVYGYAKYRQFQTYKATSKAGVSGFFLETTGELAGIEMATGIGQKTFSKMRNRIQNWNLKTVRQADLSMKGFERYNAKLGYKETVYMERYGGLKVTKPKTWLQAVQGYEKGQFTGRVYKYIPDEVLAYYKYGGDVNIYPKGTKFKWFSTEPTTSIKPIKTIYGEPFPFDDPSRHYEWFVRENIAKYPVPKKYKLPIEVKGKAFGYSATGKEWTGTEFKPNKIFYIDKATGTIKFMEIKGAIQYVSGKGVSAGFLRVYQRGAYEGGIGKTATKPIIYADYFDKVQINKALKEIKGWDLTGRELKAYLYGKDTGTAGTLNIAQYKKEVEGIVEIIKRIPIRKEFALKFEGWKIPIEEQIFTDPASLTKVELKGIIKNIGSIKALSGPSYSSLPLRATGFEGGYSLVSYAKPSTSFSSSISRVSSAVSDISRVSSAVSRVSGISYPFVSKVEYRGVSRPSLISDVLRKVSYIPSEVPPSRIVRVPPLFITEKLKKKVRRKAKKVTPEIQGLFPDFTARAIGLEPKMVDIEGALKEIRKIRTGLEVRRGARLKGISDKDLMKGVMA